MKKFKNLVNEIYQPKNAGEKKFFDLHTQNVAIVDYPIKNDHGLPFRDDTVLPAGNQHKKTGYHPPKDSEDAYKAANGPATEVKTESTSYSAKSAAAGKDIGKKGKKFSEIAKKAAKEYGSEKAGEKVAGAVLAKLRSEETENVNEIFNRIGKFIFGGSKKQRIDNIINHHVEMANMHNDLKNKAEEDSDTEAYFDHERAQSYHEKAATAHSRDFYNAKNLSRFATNSTIKTLKHPNTIPLYIKHLENNMLQNESVIKEKHLSPGEIQKREEVAKGIAKKHPNMPVDKKMAIATTIAKRTCETVEYNNENLEEGKKVFVPFPVAKSDYDAWNKRDTNDLIFLHNRWRPGFTDTNKKWQGEDHIQYSLPAIHKVLRNRGVNIPDLPKHSALGNTKYVASEETIVDNEDLVSVLEHIIEMNEEAEIYFNDETKGILVSPEEAKEILTQLEAE